MLHACIIKLAALGDVLRTTCILPGLWKKYSGPKVTWVTKPTALPLLAGNPYIDRVLTLEQALCSTERKRRYDVVICLDEETEACALSSSLTTSARFGSYMDASGTLRYTASSAPWFRLGLLGLQNRDELKKANRKTYPALLYSILELPGEPSRPVLYLSPEEVKVGKTHVDGEGFHIGINTGASGRWELKKLTELKTIELISELQGIGGVRLRLLGGPEERERNRRIAGVAQIREVPTDLSLREFAAVIANLGLLLTSDSLALHIALALEIPAVVFFGPTSEAEIELYGTGKKVIPREGFRCFYTPKCPHRPSCEVFQTISPMAAAVRDVLESMHRATDVPVLSAMV